MNATINILELATELAEMEMEQNRNVGEITTIEDENGCIVYTNEAQCIFDTLYDKYYSLIDNLKLN